MDLVRLVLLAGVGATLGVAFRIPSGALIGSMFMVAAGNLATGKSVDLPNPVFTVTLALLGANIGGRVTRTTMEQIRHSMLPALGVVALLLAIGLAVAYLLSALGAMNLRDALFAASPGAMSAVVGMSASAGANAALVASFHVLRIVLVTASLPLLLRLAR
jgi:hypothetical protein